MKPWQTALAVIPSPSGGRYRPPAILGWSDGPKERKEKQEAHERDQGALATMLAGAARLPDLLAARRAAWEAGLGRA